MADTGSPGYRYYTDGNGVRWTIVSAAQAFSAYVDDAEERRYIPPAPDIGPVPRSNESDEAAQAESDRARFVALREQIDSFSQAHKNELGLQVTAKAGMPWWVWAGLLWFLMKRRGG
jgi:hypothetical protein